jgi:tRNA modification GTPase
VANYTHDRGQGQVVDPHSVTGRDTIVAVATPPGIGGIGIVRLSGPSVPALTKSILGKLPQARLATLSSFYDADNTVIDEGIALYFPEPNSFTGEHVLELQGHGGPVVLDLLVKALVKQGARLARPGEFSERAFLNHKLDLSQAEAVADLIESGSEVAARSALRSLRGEFSARIHSIVKGLIALRTYVEAAIDFPEEEIDYLADNKLVDRLDQIEKSINDLHSATRQGCLLHDGMTVVLAGRPNAGKSSLLNALAKLDSAIVSETPGTTRDIVREQIQIDGLPIHVLDTAGLREVEREASDDGIEQEGMRRAQEAMQNADRILLVVDDTIASKDSIEQTLALMQLDNISKITVVINKIDLSKTRPGLSQHKDYVVVALSAKTGEGIDPLRQHLKEVMGFQPAGEGTFMARRRHIDAIERAQQHIKTGCQQLEQNRAGELLAEELRLAQNALNEITGEFNADALLGEIFSSFCIGK